MIIVNAATYAVAAFTSILLPLLPSPNGSSKNKSVFYEIKDGLKYFYNNKTIFWSVILITFANIAVVNYNVNLSRYIQNELIWSAYTFGLTLSLFSLGSLISLTLFSLIKIKKSRGILYISNLLIGGILFTFIPLVTEPWSMGFVFFFIGIAFSLTSIISTTILYEESTESLRSRVLGIASLSSLLSPIGFIIWGVLGDLINSGFTFIIAGITIIIVSLIGYLTKLAKYN